MNQEADLYKPYDQETLRPFQATLLAKRVEIMAKLQRNSNPIFVEELNGAESGDRPRLFERHNTEERKDKQNLADVEEALKRIEDGSYGCCVDCGELILLARLEALETAKRCVSCHAKYKAKNNISSLKTARELDNPFRIYNKPRRG